MKFSDYVELNPLTRLPASGVVPFIPMDAVEPGHRWVRPTQTRAPGGSGSKFEPGDTLFARITPCLENGKIAQYAGDGVGLGSTEFLVLRARPGIADPGFVFYYVLQAAFRSNAERSMTGASGRQRARPEALADYPCTFPDLDQQRRSAGILTAYDRLIENNRQRIALLEETCLALHRGWFIERAAHSASGSSVPSLLIGWDRVPLRDAVEVNPRVAVPRSGEKPFVSMGCLSNDSMIIEGVESRAGNSGAKFQNGDTLFARITPCLENGKTGFVQFLSDAKSVAFGSTEFIVLRSKSLTPEFVYLLARSDEVRGPAIKSMSGASGRQRVQEQCFDSMTVVQPPRDLLERFTDIVRPMFRLVHQLHLQNQNLRRTRDLLLPRLMSGQLSLPDPSDQPPVLSAPESAAP
jgi:type I restriction enzyme S subunit